MKSAIIFVALCTLTFIAAGGGIALIFKGTNGHVIFADRHPVDDQIKSAGCVSTEQYWSTIYPEKNFRILGFKADLYRCQLQDQKTYELSIQGYYLVVFTNPTPPNWWGFLWYNLPC